MIAKVFALLYSLLSIGSNVLRLRVRKATRDAALEDAHEAAKKDLRSALASGRVGDAGAARARVSAIGAKLSGERPANRKTGSPKK